MMSASWCYAKRKSEVPEGQAEDVNASSRTGTGTDAFLGSRRGRIDRLRAAPLLPAVARNASSRLPAGSSVRSAHAVSEPQRRLGLILPAIAEGALTLEAHWRVS
jgi:hypothetical protein